MTEVRPTSEFGAGSIGGAFPAGEWRAAAPAVPHSIHTIGGHDRVGVPRPGSRPLDAVADDPIGRQRNRAMADISGSILTHGLVPGSRLAGEEGRPHLPSSDEGTNYYVYGKKIADRDAVAPAFLDTSFGIFPVLRERPMEPLYDSDKLPPGEQEERMGSSLLVVADFDDIMDLRRGGRDYEPVDDQETLNQLPREVIKGIVVPEKMLAVVGPGIEESGLPVMPVGNTQEKFPRYMKRRPLKLTVPNYVGGVRDIIDPSRPTPIIAKKKLFVHGVRMPTRRDIEKQLQSTNL